MVGASSPGVGLGLEWDGTMSPFPLEILGITSSCATTGDWEKTFYFCNHIFLVGFCPQKILKILFWR
jgi:hypothetical protein